MNDAGVWVHVILVLVAVDMAAFFTCLAVVVDEWLLGAERRWQFGLGSMFAAFTLVALHFGVIGGIIAAR